MEMLNSLLGLDKDSSQLSITEILLRAVIIFVMTIVIVRVGHKRFLAKRSAFDVVLGFILASLLSRAINGSARFFETIACGFFLVLLHRFLGFLALYSETFENLIKGNEQSIIDNGKLDEIAARRHSITQKDLEEDLRLEVGTEDITKIHFAKIERSGQLSAARKPSVYIVEVQEGVQTIRIEVEK
jgi:uncharacterized membrane protein YcaP (DUF421 family)